MPDLDIRHVDKSKLDFDQSFLQFNVKKNKYIQKVLLDLTLIAEY